MFHLPLIWPPLCPPLPVPRFTILTHDHPVLHWDLLLELDEEGLLATWRILDDPGRGSQWRAEPLPGHRREYLDYEGPVSGDRGTVTSWDTGEYELEAGSGAGSGAGVGSELGSEVTQQGGVIACRGSRWRGRIELIPGRPDWTLRRLRD